MAGVNHTIEYRLNTPAGTVIDVTQTFTGDTEIHEDISIAASTVKQALNASIAFVRANLKEITILSDQALTFYTNSSGTPVDTIPIPAGAPVYWNASIGGAVTLNGVPLTADVSGIWVSNAGATAAHLQIEGLANP